jgi:outer membrane lipoprotein-sorting protein
LPVVNPAEDLLQDVVNQYASMTSYSDSGAVHMKIAGSEDLYSQTFTTMFKRPAFFRFEFSRPHPYEKLRHVVKRYVVGFDGKAAYFVTKRHDAPPTREERSNLELAVAGATGVSSGSVHTIARLLLPEVYGLSLLDSTDVRFNSERAVDGVACYSVTAQHPKIGGAREIWIEKDSLLLRKVIRAFSKTPCEEMRKQIRVDELLRDRLFEAPVV